MNKMNNDLVNPNIDNLPKHSGIYIMRDNSNKIIYVGKATSLKNRVKSYFSNREINLKNSILIKAVKNIEYILTKNAKEALILEEAFIKRFQPKYNIIWKDDKRYPYLNITKEKYPSLEIVRTKKINGGKYFGPYPEATEMKSTLKLIYKIFGVRPCRYNLDKRKNECLYYFMKKCPAPCIGKITEKEYLNIITKVKMFLSGKNKLLLKTLEKEMTAAKNNLEYEKAAKLRNTIFAIKNTLEKVNFKEITIDDVLLNIDMPSYLQDLSAFLNKNINRIEGFDISNISGKTAVGSMVVFENGVPKKMDYRRFKIKTVKQINDFEMLGEIINRRYGGSLAKNTLLPDLIVIDGGKGQLTAAVSVLSKYFTDNQMPKVVAIAKKNEELYFIGNSKPVILSKNSLALNLIKYVRDEAHRFAISYHKYLRKQSV
ncbi:MAG: excinuclease ABC subunit UvrC [Elusimicrobia bacterium]|nr:excinuclease ABC subunit UvrC [Elusimicrobiota bacterium]